MKIALITDGIYPFVLGGMQKHSYYLAKYFSRLGHQTTVFHCTQEKKIDYTVHFNPKELENLSFEEFSFPNSDTLPGHYVRNSEKYSKLLLEKYQALDLNFDFIYTKGFTGLAFLKKKEKIKVPIGVQLHGLEMFQKGGNLKQWAEKKLLKMPAKECLKKADVVFSYGGKISEIVREVGVPKSKIIKQHGAANDYWLQDLPLNRDYGNSIAFVGRFEHRKGHHLVNEVIPQLNAEFKLIMIGEVPPEKQLAHPNLVYLGNQSAEQVFEILRKTTFLLTPSLAEGFPTVIVEAMGQGVVPIATNVGAVEEIINSDNGFLFEPNSASELRNTIEKALSLTSEQREYLSLGARKQVEENFNWDFSAAKLLSEIKQISDSWKRTHSKGS